MTNEEKEAIERLIIYKDKIKDELYPIIDFEEEKAIGIALNLIEKLSKEIEELKTEKAKRSWVHIKENGEVEPLFYVSEDKIKAKIEELKKYSKEHGYINMRSEINVLQSLLKDGGE